LKTDYLEFRNITVTQLALKHGRSMDFFKGRSDFSRMWSKGFFSRAG